MAFCCFPTLPKKITSELVAIRFGGKIRKSEQHEEKKRRMREEIKEKAENPTLVQLVSLGYVGKNDEEVKDSGASSQVEREKEGRSKSESVQEKADDIVECESRCI